MDLTIEEIKAISIVDYLSRYGHNAQKVQGNRYWYLSPLPYHNEKHASFKVDADINMWYDFALGQGGNIINLVQEMHPEKSKSEVIVHLKEFSGGIITPINSRPVPNMNELVERNENIVSDTDVVRVVELSHPNLLQYLTSRGINLDVARKYCKEVYYTFKGQYQFYAIAFMNQSGGMETRNMRFKRCIGKKDITIISKQREYAVRQCCVFEGFFDFLSYKTCRKNHDNWLCLEKSCDYVVLNSVALVSKAIKYLEYYDKVHLYLDNDQAGRDATWTIMDNLGEKAKDESFRYSNFGDINDFLTGNTRSL